MGHRHTWRVRAVAAALGVLATLLASSCGSPSPSQRTAVSFAEGAGLAPNYILPLAKSRYFNVQNLAQFQMLMYRPLYWFGDNGQVHLNEQLSLADPPQYSPDGKSVTITLKHYTWSDGQPVTTRDIVFWQNLVSANKTNWAAYTPGEYPDNITGTTVNSPTSITFHLSQAYGSYFFTYNELSQITPLPQHVWDKRSATEPVGQYDTTPSGAQAVYAFLDAESSKSTNTYATNPLWSVVDGPWKLRTMDGSGNVTMVPNTLYSGPVKPQISEFREVAFSKDSDELSSLRGSGAQVDYGYLPIEDASDKDQITSRGYALQPWVNWQVTYFPENFTNPTSGVLFQQPYFRQAMQSLVDQTGLINRAFDGYGYPTYGPVPSRPPSPFLDSTEQSDPLPYNPGYAVTLLKTHGWTVNPGGISTCAAPGPAATQCGAGIPAGAQAVFHLEYISGYPWVDTEMTLLKTDFSKAGIQINLSTNNQQNVLANAVPCTTGKPCTWDMEFWVSGWVYYPDYYPTGDETYASTAFGNGGGYSDPAADQLISATLTSSSLQALYAYEDYLAKTPPVIWMPTQDSQLSMISSELHGVEQDPTQTLNPEAWRWG